MLCLFDFKNKLKIIKNTTTATKVSNGCIFDMSSLTIGKGNDIDLSRQKENKKALSAASKCLQIYQSKKIKIKWKEIENGIILENIAINQIHFYFMFYGTFAREK